MSLEHFSFSYLPPKFCKHCCFCPPRPHVQYLCLRFNYLNKFKSVYIIYLSTTGSGNKVLCTHYLMIRRRKTVIYCIHSDSFAPTETTFDTQWRIRFPRISACMARMGKIPTPLLGCDSRSLNPQTITSLTEAQLPLVVYSVSYITR